MQDTHALPYLREVLLFLTLAGILIPLLQRLRINQVLGFLVTGTLIGPFSLGLWADNDKHAWLAYVSFLQAGDIAPLADLGVLFLMFMIGLELSTERLWELRRWVFGAGVAQVLLTATVIGIIARGFGHATDVAALLGLVLSLSSTAVVMQLLNDRRSLGSPLGQASFSILMLQDLAVVPIFIFIGVLRQGGEGWLPLAGLALLKSAGAILLIYWLGRRVIRPAFRAFARDHQPDVFMALTLLASLGIAGLTAAAGLSMALGAFLAGLLLAETEYRHEVEVTIEPFKGLLMGLFFMSVGMQIDVREIARSPVWLPLSVVGLFLIKGSVLGLLFRAGGMSWGRAAQGALLLGQGGEFAFIVIGIAQTTGLIKPDAGKFIMLVVGGSMFATPFAASMGNAFATWWQRRFDTSHDEELRIEPAGGHIVIAGFGRVGQLVGNVLESQHIAYVALESNVGLVARLRSEGFPVFFGNASRADLLAKVHAERAAAVVLTMDHPASVLHALKAIRQRHPHLPVLARCRDERHARALKNAGATLVVPETLESGLQLCGYVLRQTGLDEGNIARIVQQERECRAGTMAE